MCFFCIIWCIFNVNLYNKYMCTNAWRNIFLCAPNIYTSHMPYMQYISKYHFHASLKCRNRWYFRFSDAFFCYWINLFPLCWKEFHCAGDLVMYTIAGTKNMVLIGSKKELNVVLHCVHKRQSAYLFYHYNRWTVIIEFISCTM